MLKKFMAGAVMLGIAGGAVAFCEPPAGKLIRGTRGADTGATGPNGETLRADDPGDPIQAATRTYFAGQTYDDHLKTMIGGQGPDKFIIKTYISGKPAIVAKHVNDDGTINWGAVATGKWRRSTR